ncbi:hypothetical protein JOM56_002119 [Amanita muscaria]
MSQQTSHLDPYTEQAEKTDVTLQEKIQGLHGILHQVKTGMFTTRSPGGYLHSRAMTPASPVEENQLKLVFIANRVTHKCDEVENDEHVNVSFYDPSTTNWASYCGTAKIIQDKEMIKKYWSIETSAWFGDLKDGIHRGDVNDPVSPSLKWFLTRLGTGSRRKTACPGEIRTITKSEIELTCGLHLT